MIIKSYKEAVEICRAETNLLVESKQLANYCKKHKLEYHKVQVFIRGNEKRRYPKLISKFLESMGYKVSISRKVVYEFILE